MQAQINLTPIQSHIVWEDKEENLRNYGELLSCVANKTDIAVLPELFTTGLSLRTADLAETNSGKTIATIKQYAADYNIAITGSFMATEDGKYYNRAFFVTPQGQANYYDKRHLFSMAGEDKSYSRGNKRLIVDYLGWKICLMVCYDLRFPVWSRNVGNEYDLLIYVANWPEARKDAWKALLKARAIENMSYVCGVNCIGTDANDFKYHGGSVIYTPKGEKHLNTEESETSTTTHPLHRDKLETLRTKFPAWKDADPFTLNED